MARLPLGAAERPAQPGEPRGSARFSSPPVPESPGRECLVPAAPSPGPEGRAGRRPTLSSPPPPRPGASRSRSRSRATAAAPDSRRPQAGAARGVGRAEGPGGAGRERASRRHLAAVPRARPWRSRLARPARPLPRPEQAGHSRPGEGENRLLTPRACWPERPPGLGKPPSLAPPLGSNPAGPHHSRPNSRSVHSLLRSRRNLVSDF